MLRDEIVATSGARPATHQDQVTPHVAGAAVTVAEAEQKTEARDPTRERMNSVHPGGCNGGNYDMTKYP